MHGWRACWRTPNQKVLLCWLCDCCQDSFCTSSSSLVTRWNTIFVLPNTVDLSSIHGSCSHVSVQPQMEVSGKLNVYSTVSVSAFPQHSCVTAIYLVFALPYVLQVKWDKCTYESCASSMQTLCHTTRGICEPWTSVFPQNLDPYTLSQRKMELHKKQLVLNHTDFPWIIQISWMLIIHERPKYPKAAWV